MRAPPPNRDHIETRLLLVAEMLDQAVKEVHRVMAEIKGEPCPPDSEEVRRTDGNQRP